MLSFVEDFFEDLAKDAIKQINKWLIDLLDISLNCQDYMGNHLNLKGIDFAKINSVILKYAIALLILKFVTKGFSIYILQSDGDPDHDPLTLLTGFFQSVAIAVTFYSLYGKIIDIFKAFAKELLKAMGSDGEIQTIKTSLINSLLGQGITTILLVIVLVVLFAVLYVKLIMNGGELMVLRFAIPILSVGFLDADGGTAKVAAKKFLQVAFTNTVQIILLRLSVALLLTLHPIWAIAVTGLAFRVPNLMQEFLFVRSGGGGAFNKLNTLANLKRLFT